MTTIQLPAPLQNAISAKTTGRCAGASESPSVW